MYPVGQRKYNNIKNIPGGRFSYVLRVSVCVWVLRVRTKAGDGRTNHTVQNDAFLATLRRVMCVLMSVRCASAVAH